MGVDNWITAAMPDWLLVVKEKYTLVTAFPMRVSIQHFDNTYVAAHVFL